MKPPNRRRLSLLAAGAAAMAGITLPAASALADDFATGSQLSTRTKTSVVPARTTSQQFAPLRTAAGENTFPAVQFTVPAGQSRVYEATFSGASSCSAKEIIVPHCDVRIVAVKAGGGAAQQLAPADFQGTTFDSGNRPTNIGGNDHSDAIESHSVKGSIRLDPGTYGFFVEFRARVPTVDFFLQNMTFSVQEYAPLGSAGTKGRTLGGATAERLGGQFNPVPGGGANAGFGGFANARFTGDAGRPGTVLAGLGAGVALIGAVSYGLLRRYRRA